MPGNESLVGRLAALPAEVNGERVLFFGGGEVECLLDVSVLVFAEDRMRSLRIDAAVRKFRRDVERYTEHQVGRTEGAVDVHLVEPSDGGS